MRLIKKIFLLLIIFESHFSYTQENNNHFPYPVILIHGIADSYGRWSTMVDYSIQEGWSYGGELNICLNADSNNSTSDIFSVNSKEIKSFIPNNLPAADFYCLNFDVDPSGIAHNTYGVSSSFLSNQSAILKQGKAVGIAIQKVLAATGKDKVILVGHSMGGLASRTYLQNSIFWQADAQTHVAKLLTLGTPHGGSNTTANGLGALLAIDESSEAVRDLRTSYYYSNASGVFLFGGTESETVMDDRLVGFYNYDANCNGVIGDNVVGLNQKPMQTNIDYTCVVGDYTLDLAGGDMIVPTFSANIKNFYPNLISETYTLNETHVDLPYDIEYIYNGMDEPDYANLAYAIAPNNIYNAFITLQASDASSLVDNDFFRFTIANSSNYSIKINDIPVNDFNFSIIKTTDNSVVYSSSSNGNSNIESPILGFNAGDYYLKTWGTANDTSWENPYRFIIQNSSFVVNASTNQNTICNGSSTQISTSLAGNSGTCSYSWLPANGLSSTSIANPIASPTTTTTYTVTASYLSQTATNSVVITVNPIPSITFTPSVTSICVGQSANILVSGASSYSWSPALGLNQTTGNYIIASPSSNITYTVTGTSNGCSTSASTAINVNALPVVSTNAASVNICAGQSTLLSATGASSYSWSPALGLNQTTGNYIVSTPSANTTYTVTGTSNTCSASSSIIVYVNPIPSISVNPTTSSICNGESISLSANGANSYVWSPSNGLNQSAGNSIIASPSSNTTYTVTGTSNACSASQNVYVFVNPIPNSSFSLSKANDICTNEAITITYTGTINPFSVYSWNFDNAYLLSGNISSAGPFLIKWNVEGNHTISLSERLNNCQSDTFTINAFVEVCTNIELLKTDDINVFPSPATNFITIEGIKPNSTIRISDLTGRTIYFKDNYCSNTLNIDVSSFAVGNYCVIIQNSNYSVYKAFVKKDE
ncbi:MAG: alpha/beta fold hydrolase [Bacteroidota bacterium]